MKFKGTPNISGFVDFCSYHANGEPIYLVNGKIYASFDMLSMIECRYNFLFSDSKKETEKAIMENMYMFDVVETNQFYYPNDNMFSGNNSIKGIKGNILTLKKKYARGYEADMVIETLLQENARIKKEYANYMEKVARSEISAKEWKNRVTTKLMKTDPNIEKDDLFFSATSSGYSLAYKPYFPEKSSADFEVYGSFDGGIHLHGNFQSLLPTIITYGNIEEFENN